MILYLPETTQFVLYSNGLAIWHGLSDIIIDRSYSFIKQLILFYSNGLPIWHGLPDIRYIKINYDR